MNVEEQETQHLPFLTHTTPVKTVPVNSATSVTSGTLFQQYLDTYHLTSTTPCLESRGLSLDRSLRREAS